MTPAPEALVVAGDGPSGLAAAITGALCGFPTTLLTPPARERAVRALAFGESLPPVSRRVLEDLGIWDDFRRDGHLACPGNLSAWTSNRLDAHDFVSDPHGHGWHVDRGLLLTRLRERAERIGVRFVEGPPGALDRTRAGTAIIDATGRASRIARSQGARRVRLDRQIASVMHLSPRGEPLADRRSLVEACPWGWSYSGVQRDGTLVVCAFTDAGVLAPPALRSLRATLADTAPHTRDRIEAHGARTVAGPVIVAAAEEQLAPLRGTGWYAIGDAALSLDPISSHGLTMGMAAARDLVRAIRDARAQEFLDAFSRRVDAYRERRRAIYAAQRRWRDQPYWRARGR